MYICTRADTMNKQKHNSEGAPDNIGGGVLFFLPGGMMLGLSHLEPLSEDCPNLLSMLAIEIMTLCDTVTNCLVQPVDHQDAIRAI